MTITRREFVSLVPAALGGYALSPLGAFNANQDLTRADLATLTAVYRKILDRYFG